MKNAELHIHSYYSDGQFSPKNLVKLAKKRGIKNLALTDHNSVKGVREAISEGKKIGIKIIPGIEVTFDKGEVLGYFIDINNKKLLNKITIESKRYEKRIAEWCDTLTKNGYNVSFREIWKKYPKARGNINSFHPLFELHSRGYGTTLNLAKTFRENKKLKFKEMKRITIIEAIKLIKQANGVPVLAHPWVEDETLNEKNFKKYVKAGLMGIEINNGDNAPFKKKGTDKKIRKIAKKYNLIITSGSDYHGARIFKQMPGNHDLGKNNCDEKVVYQLMKANKIV